MGVNHYYWVPALVESVPYRFRQSNGCDEFDKGCKKNWVGYLGEMISEVAESKTRIATAEELGLQTEEEGDE